MIRVGFGYDVHRFESEKSDGACVVICGVKIPFERSLIAHSDGDVGIHSAVDAILGAACIDAARDIGQVFSPDDDGWKDRDSCYFLRTAKDLIEKNGLVINNIDITIVCQKIRISTHREQMYTKIASILGLPLNKVNVKATTTEMLGFEGRSEGISSYCVASLLDV